MAEVVSTLAFVDMALPRGRSPTSFPADFVLIFSHRYSQTFRFLGRLFHYCATAIVLPCVDSGTYL